MATPHTRVHEPRSDIAVARARYETLRTLLLGLLVAIVLASLFLLAWQGVTIRDNQRQIAQLLEENQAEAEGVAEMIRRQDASEQRRQVELDQAVADLTAEQRRALVAHDHSIRDFLQRTLRLLDEEVNAPENQERLPPLVLPPTREPFVGPTVQPAPKPAPCDKAGKSGRCKR